MVTACTAADLRAELARRQIVIYRLAAKVGMHPGRLGMMLAGTIPLPADVAAKIMKAIDEIATD